MRAICIIRTSTDRQQIAEQTAEVVQMAKNDGFTDDNIVVIGKCGASAIKLDDAYLENMNRVYQEIENGDIDCVYAWAIDRIGRDEVVLMQFKNELIKHKVQLKIKNPALTLFNIDKTVNTGVELAFSLFATMSKQEMIQKKERFARGKRQYGREERYTGGTIAFGYSVNENGKYVINDDEAAVVKKIFIMYASGKYSLKTLSDELQKRNILWRSGKKFTLSRVRTLLYATCYTGISGGKKIQRFPRIISDDLYNAVREILTDNKTAVTQQTLHNYFANKLIHCPECGYHYSANGRLYRCVKHSNNKAWSIGKKNYVPCRCDISISIPALDGLLYMLSKTAHERFLRDELEQRNDFLKNENEEIREKISGLEAMLSKYTEKKKRITNAYVDEIYDEKEYRERLKRLDIEYKSIRNELTALNEKLTSNLSMISGKRSYGKIFDDSKKLTRGFLNDAEEKNLAELVRQYIREVKLMKFEPGMRDSYIDSEMMKYIEENGMKFKYDKQATLIDIIYVNGETETYVYFPRKISKLRFWKIQFRRMIPVQVELMERNGNGCYTEELRLAGEICRRARDLNDEKNVTVLKKLLSHYKENYSAVDYRNLCELIESDKIFKL